MPVIKSAIKKLRQDRKREKMNDAIRASLKLAISKAKKSKNGKDVSLAFSVVDKAAKKNIIHANKAARLKSALAKIAKPITSKSLEKAIVKTSADKKSPKAASKKKSK